MAWTLSSAYSHKDTGGPAVCLCTCAALERDVSLVLGGGGQVSVPHHKTGARPVPLWVPRRESFNDAAALVFPKGLAADTILSQLSDCGRQMSQRENAAQGQVCYR